MASVREVMDALADQLTTELGTVVFDGLTVYNRLEPNPTPPALDVYPADPFIEQTAYGISYQYNFVIRARVTTADYVAGPELLLQMMDPASDQSVAAAISADRTLGGNVDFAVVAEGSPSAFGEYRDSGGDGSLLGCQWTVNVEVTSTPTVTASRLLQETGGGGFTLENGSGVLLEEG